MTDNEKKAALLAELKDLRRGFGIRSTDLHKRVGPMLRELCGIEPDAGAPEIRAKLIRAISALTELTAEDFRVVELALGAHRPPLLQLLGVRTEQIEHELALSKRTARRRIDRAFEALTDEMLAARAAATKSRPDPESGWRVAKLRARLRLDTPAPEVVETRTIEATRDGLRTIVARMSLPKRDASDGHTEAHLSADLEEGARIIDQEETEGHFRYVLELPRKLANGERHDYTIKYSVPPSQVIRTHYAFVPMVACEEFTVRARFDPANLPAVVWRLDRLPPVVMANHLAPGLPLELDGACEVALTFRNMDQGFGYGVAWLPG
jgi:hypothetical protein